MGLFKRKQKPKDDGDNESKNEFEELDADSEGAEDIMARLEQGAGEAQRELEERRQRRERAARRSPCGCWG